MNSTCQNGGQCIPNDDHIISDRKFTCICLRGYSGDRCEIFDNQLILSFDKGINLLQAIFIHFIEIINRKPPIRSTVLAKTNVKMMVNVFKIVQIVLKDQYVCVNHVSMVDDVNLVQVDLVYHWMQLSVII